MKLMVTGIGGVGGYIAAVLCANYNDVTLVARRARKEALETKGLVVYSDFFCNHTFHPAVTDTPAQAGIQDIIFVCVKNYSLRDALAAVEPCIGEDTVIVLILNGVDHLDAAKKILSKGQLVDSAIYITSAYDADYAIRQAGHYARIVLGSDCTSAVKKAYETLNHPGLTCQIASDIQAEIWNKYILNCAYNVMTAYYDCNIGDVLDNPTRHAEFRQLLTEAYTVGTALGVHLDQGLVDTIDGRIMRLDAKDVTSSLARDVAAHRQSELETFSGYLVRTAKELGISAPLSEKCYTTLLERAGQA